MGKRRRHSVASITATNNNKNASGRGSNERTTVVTREEKTSAHDILWPTLEALDGILDEAHQQMQHEQQSAKSTQDEDMKDINVTVQRGSAVYAAMSRPHYNALSEAVITYGSQLLPSLPDLTRRVRLALQLPALSTVECWQTAALLCTYYGVGMSGMVSDLVEMAVRTSGLCLLALPQMHLPESCLALQHTSHDSEESNKAGVWHAANAEQRIWFTRATYKLEALREMLLSASALVPVQTLHKFATRFALEVIEDGILSSLEALATGEDDNVSVFATASNNTATRSAKALHYRVPIELHAPCVRLLQAFLLLSPAPPAELRVCANRVVRELGADLHSGTVVLEETIVDEKSSTATSKSAKNTNTKPVTKKSDAMVGVLGARRILAAAVVELRQTLHLLHHPPTLPAYSPAHIVTERVTRRVWIDEANEASDTKGEEKTRDAEECVTKTALAALPTTTTTTTTMAMMSAGSAVTTPSQALIHTAEPQPTQPKEEEEVVTVTKSTVTQAQTTETTAAADSVISKKEIPQAVSEVMPSTSTRQHATVEPTVQYEDEDDDDDDDADFPEIDIED